MTTTSGGASVGCASRRAPAADRAAPRPRAWRRGRRARRSSRRRPRSRRGPALRIARRRDGARMCSARMSDCSTASIEPLARLDDSGRAGRPGSRRSSRARTGKSRPTRPSDASSGWPSSAVSRPSRLPPADRRAPALVPRRATRAARAVVDAVNRGGPRRATRRVRSRIARVATGSRPSTRATD